MESHRNLKERGISVVGVPVDGEGWAKVRPFAAKLNVNYPMVTHIGLVSKQTYESDIERILSEPF